MKLRIADFGLPIVGALAVLAGAATAAFAQPCYIDPLTGQRYCLPNPQSPIYNPQFGSGQFENPQSETRDPQSPHCRITVGNGSAGSGTLVRTSDAAGLILTCAHLFDGGSANIVVTFTSGQRFAGALVERDRAHDLAAIVIRRPSAASAPVAAAIDELGGTPLSACGFGPNGQLRCVRGAIVGQATPVGAAYPSIVFHGAVRPGDSGGGVFNPRGELVGVIWGQRDGRTYATCGRPVREFLERLLGRGKVAANDDQRAGSTEQGAEQGNAGSVAGGVMAPTPPSTAPSPTDWPARLNEIAARIEAVYGRLETMSRAAERGGGWLAGLSAGKLLAAALGLSGPPAVALAIGLAIARRRVKTRVTTRAPSGGIAATVDRPVAVDTPPPPQQAIPETHYVPYEQDSFAKAHQWACEQVVRKYPGSTEVLHTQDSLIKQYLAAQ